MNWLRPANSTNPLQEQAQKLLDKDQTSGGSTFRLDIDKEIIRQVIGESFVEEPILKWSIEHFDRTKVLTTQDELVHFSRFINSMPLLEDLGAPLHFQLCEVEPNTKTNDTNTNTDYTVISCTSLHACDPIKPRGPKWFRHLKLSYVMAIHVIKIMYRFGDSLPKAIHSPCMSRMEAKVKPWMDVEEWHYEYGPKRPHWYLHLVGVNPAYNGQGKGKAIMNKICELADELDQDIYLEAGGKMLKCYYEKFGFVVKKVMVFADPEDDQNSIDVHLMVREANKQTAGATK